MTPLATYLVAAMLSWSPVTNHPEGAPVTEARYDRIAADVAALVSQPDVEPLFAGPDGRARTAVLLVSIGSFESGGFAQAVQTCARLGDGGRARGIWQLHGMAAPASTACSTPYAQAAAALEWARLSVVRCSRTGQEPATWLAAYASGSCSRGWLASRNRWGRAAAWMAKHPFAVGG